MFFTLVAISVFHGEEVIMVIIVEVVSDVFILQSMLEPSNNVPLMVKISNLFVIKIITSFYSNKPVSKHT